jgi:hypothetical protein
VSISSRERNISIIDIRLNDILLDSPFSFISKDTSEQVIVVTVKGLSEGHHDYLDYVIESEGESRLFSTRVLVDPPIIDDTYSRISQGSSMIMIVVIAFIAAGGYILYSFLRHRRGE